MVVTFVLCKEKQIDIFTAFSKNQKCYHHFVERCISKCHQQNGGPLLPLFRPQSDIMSHIFHGLGESTMCTYHMLSVPCIDILHWWLIAPTTPLVCWTECQGISEIRQDCLINSSVFAKVTLSSKIEVFSTFNLCKSAKMHWNWSLKSTLIQRAFDRQLTIVFQVLTKIVG